MSEPILEQLMQQAETLSSAEQLTLMAHLIERLQHTQSQPDPQESGHPSALSLLESFGLVGCLSIDPITLTTDDTSPIENDLIEKYQQHRL